MLFHNFIMKKHNNWTYLRSSKEIVDMFGETKILSDTCWPQDATLSMSKCLAVFVTVTAGFNILII